MENANKEPQLNKEPQSEIPPASQNGSAINPSDPNQEQEVTWVLVLAGKAGSLPTIISGQGYIKQSPGGCLCLRPHVDLPERRGAGEGPNRLSGADADSSLSIGGGSIDVLRRQRQLLVRSQPVNRRNVKGIVPKHGNGELDPGKLRPVRGHVPNRGRVRRKLEHGAGPKLMG